MFFLYDTLFFSYSFIKIDSFLKFVLSFYNKLLFVVTHLFGLLSRLKHWALLGVSLVILTISLSTGT